jgi:DNA-binding MarR family transcriptional regulator
MEDSEQYLRMYITDRDKKILRFINDFGGVQCSQISKFIGTHKQNIYRRLRKMRSSGYVQRHPFWEHREGVFTTTFEGNEIINDTLKPMRRIHKGMIDHDLTLVDLAIKITCEEDVFIPERRIRQNPDIWEFEEHIPDGLIKKDTGELIAIELELSIKTKQRLEVIFDFYSSHADVSEVRYYVGDKYVEAAIKKKIDEYGLGRVSVTLCD